MDMKFINFFKTHQTISAIILATVMFFGTFLIFSATASAQNVTITGDVQHHYKIVIDRQPYNVEICQKGNQSGASAGDLLSGAIIGGAIGNNIKGEENGGAIGALLGTIFANEKAKQDKCFVETRYDETRREVYDYSTFTFQFEGKTYTTKFIK
tara:strand:- start:709 stop:1170 length:462 start_codon:yes stop_codon:yes gene_type:complete